MKRFNENLLFFFGIKRSGNHAIINWILDHYNEPKAFRNNHTIGIQLENLEKWFNANKDKNRNVVLISLEDACLSELKNKNIIVNEEETIGKSINRKNIIILRDPYNMFASQYHHYNVNLKKLPKFETYLNLWKSYAKEFLDIENNIKEDKIAINFNEWFKNIDYRKSISKKLGVKFTDKGLNKISSKGKGSTFDGMSFNDNAQNMKVLERWKTITDTEFFSRLKNDKELNTLSEKIFDKIV